MSGNAELLRKADIIVSDLDNGGLLNPEQSAVFIRKLLVQPVMLNKSRNIVMSAPQRKVNKIQFNKRILRRAATQAPSGTALPKAQRSKPITEQIVLNTDEVIAEIRLPYDVLEDNIERGNIGMQTDVGGQPTSGGLRDTIMTLIAERAALDLEEIALLGDTDSADDYLAMTDGWLKRADQNVLNAGGAPITRQVLTSGMKAMPKQYRRDRGALCHFVSTEKEIDYRETIAQRETASGDSQTMSLAPIYAAAAPVKGVGLMPDDAGILAHPMNLLFGIQRQIHVETDKDISERVYIIVLTARVAFQIEEGLAAVRYVGIG